MLAALKAHYPEYLMEAFELGLFMVAVCVFGTLLFYPSSALVRLWPSPSLRQFIMGLAMGLTAVGIIYSPWGKQSGAHINPAVTLAFYSLKKIKPWDALFYIVFQFTGAVMGVFLAAQIIGKAIQHPDVRYFATFPHRYGEMGAFTVEFLISFFLMLVVLVLMNKARLTAFLGIFVGILVALYANIAGPISGFSMNPARTFGSALPSTVWTSCWIYFTAPIIGMLLAAQLFSQFSKHRSCAKLHHENTKRCIHCGKPEEVYYA